MAEWRRFRRPRLSRGRDRYLDEAEIERFLAAASPELRRLILLLIYTGCRISEAIRLEWRDVDLERGYVSFRRTKTTPRAAALHPRVIEALGAPGEGRVFHWRTRWGPRKAWAKALLDAGIEDFTRHDCRHTFATLLRRRGGLDTLGLLATGAWRDPKSVARYAHATADEAQAAVARLPHSRKIRGARRPRRRKPA